MSPPVIVGLIVVAYATFFIRKIIINDYKDVGLKEKDN